MDNQKLFLYAGLAFIGMLIWQQWQLDYGPQPAPVVQENGQSNTINANNTQTDLSNDMPEMAADNSSRRISDATAMAAPTAIAKIVKVETDLVQIEIDTRGGVITSLKLKKHPITVEEKDNYLELAFKKEDESFVIQSGLRSKNSVAPTHHDVYHSASLNYSLDDGANELVVPLTWQKDGITVTKTYTFSRNSYAVSVSHKVNNQTNDTWMGSQYRQITRSRPLDESKLLYTYTGAVVYNEEVKYDKVDFDDIEDENLRLNSDGGWIAMIQHYFLAAWVPEQEKEKNLIYSLKNLKTYPAVYTIGMRSDNSIVNSQSEHTFNSQLFIGPKLTHELEKLSTGLDLTVDYGYLTFISKPIKWLLEKIHGFVGNWGLAIILLTVMIKIVFYKLSETSYRSMAKMRKVGPRLKALKERHGDDRQAMNQAMMDLYKKEKINPMSGCLPILVQIPVFIGLYWALLESVELRQAPFILWINDLSVMDPYFVLPVIMGVSMIIQQRLNPAPPDPIQAKVMMALPLVFTVFFAFFPSGLVLYWVVNNVLSITQQYVITKRIEAEK